MTRRRLFRGGSLPRTFTSRCAAQSRAAALAGGGLVVLALAAGCSSAKREPTASASAGIAASLPALTAVGNALVANGQPIRLLGASHSGTEYACVQGWGIFEGPTDDTAIGAMAAWNINVVRVPLNEDCWLGINGVNAAYAGAAYQSAIVDYVTRLHQHGIYAILELHWNAPGSTPATGQQVMADADHSPAMWTSVASAFQSDSAVVFDLYNEPHDISWSCWRDGCSASGFQTAGMQSLVDAVRSTGATQPLMLGGLGWAGDLTGWLANQPSDPQNQLVASVHNYNFGECVTSSCWDSEVLPVASVVPVVTGELGENDCAGSYVDSYMAWADAHGISYLGWTWNTWGCSAPALISDYTGTPTVFGQAFHDHLLALGTSGAPDAGSAADAADAGPPTFQAIATASPALAGANASVTIQATVTNQGSPLSNGVVDIEEHDSSGNKVGQQYFWAQSFASGQSLPFSFAWTAPASAGTYTIEVGVFGASWTPLYTWLGNAGTLQVLPGDPAPYNFEADAGSVASRP